MHLLFNRDFPVHLELMVKMEKMEHRQGYPYLLEEWLVICMLYLYAGSSW